jgi:hypothetical protein
MSNLRGKGLQSTRAGSVFARGGVSRNAAYDQPERNAQLQHECAENEKAFAYAPVVGDPTHQRRDQDRGEPLPSLTQAHDRTLLMATDRSRLVTTNMTDWITPSTAHRASRPRPSVSLTNALLIGSPSAGCSTLVYPPITSLSFLAKSSRR